MDTYIHTHTDIHKAIHLLDGWLYPSIQSLLNALNEVNIFSMSTLFAITTTLPEVCMCRDLKRKQSWLCNETWTEDCFNKICTGGKIELTQVVCPVSTIPSCPRGQVKKISDGCCETWTCDCKCILSTVSLSLSTTALSLCVFLFHLFLPIVFYFTFSVGH